MCVTYLAHARTWHAESSRPVQHRREVRVLQTRVRQSDDAIERTIPVENVVQNLSPSIPHIGTAFQKEVRRADHSEETIQSG